MLDIGSRFPNRFEGVAPLHFRSRLLSRGPEFEVNALSRGEGGSQGFPFFMDFCELMRMFTVLRLLKFIVQRIIGGGKMYNCKLILMFKKRQQTLEDTSTISYKTEPALTM